MARTTRVAWIGIGTDGLASVHLEGGRAYERGPSDTSLDDALHWANERTTRVVVRDDSWDGEHYSAGPDPVDDTPPWPPEGYVPPDVPAAPRVLADDWAVELRVGAARADHGPLVAAILRAVPGGARVLEELEDSDVVVRAPLGVTTELAAYAEAQRVDGALGRALRRDPQVTFRWSPAGEAIRPVGAVRFDRPRAALIRQVPWDPTADAFLVDLAGGYDQPADPPHLRPYAEALAWARRHAETVLVARHEGRFRPATDERPALADPVLPERFDPPVTWRGTFELSVGATRPTAMAAALERALSGPVTTESFASDDFGNAPPHWMITVRHEVVAASEAEAAGLVERAVVAAARGHADGLMLSFAGMVRVGDD